MLRQHQISGVDFLVKSNGGLVADEMGTGKTRLALEFGRRCIQEGKADVILIVCPPALVTNWEEEIRGYYGFDPCVYHRKRDLTSNRVYLTTYALLRYKAKGIPVHFQTIKEHLTGKRLVVILDEAHEIKNSESQTALACYSLPAAIKVSLTGTPIQNKPEDLYGILYFNDRTIDKRWFFSNFIITQTKEIHVKGGRRVYVRQVVGYKNQDELNSFLSSRMIRRLKKDCLDLPEKTRIYQPYEQSDLMYTQTRELADLSDEPMMVKVVRLQEAASGLNPYDETKEDFKPGEKFNVLNQLLEGRSGRIVVWFKFYETLQHVSKLLRKKGYEIFEWHGRNSVARDTQRRLWSVSESGIFLATIKSAGVGLNLTEAETAIFYETELSPAAAVQAEDRLHRIGQQLPTTIFYLYGRDSVEEAIVSLLRKKAHLNSVVTDGFTDDDLRQVYRYSFKLGY